MNKKRSIPLLLVAFCYLLLTETKAEVKLPNLFSNNMVLQQKSNVAIWGKAQKESAITIKPSWAKEKYKTQADKTGQWKIQLPTPKAGGPYTIEISDGTAITLKNILIGEVWLCAGQSNMEMPMKGFRGEPVAGSNMDILKSRDEQLRFISVPRKSTTEPQEDFKGQWKSANPETVANFSATAYYFAELLRDLKKDTPVGLIEVSYGGSNAEAWMGQDMLKNYKEIKVPANDDEIDEPNRTPTALFNGMLNPVIGYGIKGCIWYQGESNAERPFQYEQLFPDMVKYWRELWDIGDFPFYYAQIAPFDYSIFYPDGAPEKANSAYLRDAQRKAQYQIPNSGMTVLLDAGDKKSIHPANKQVIGERLAYLALGKTYGIEGIGYACPDYDELNPEDSSIIVTFKNIPNGITSYGKEVTLFEIAGKDKKFYPAHARVRRKSVVLHAPEVEKPIAVRYAFKDFVEAQLFSNEGIPVTSFRTDNW